MNQATDHFVRLATAVSLASLVTFFNLYQVQALLPLFESDFALAKGQSTYALSLCMFGLALGMVVAAAWSDRVGRRGILLGSILLSPIFSLLIAASAYWQSSFTLLLLLRFIQGLVLAGLPAVAIAYLGDQLSRSQLLKAVGIYIAANSLGGIGGRVLGGWSAEWFGDWRASFVLIACLSFALSLLVWRLLPKPVVSTSVTLPEQSHAAATREHKRFSASLQAYWQHLRQPPLLASFIVAGLCFGTFVNQFSYLSLVLADEPFNLSPGWTSLLFLAYLGGTCSSSLSGRWALRFGATRCIQAGLLLLVSGSLLSLAQHLPVVILAMVLSSMGFFMAHAQASAWVNQQARSNKASASALYTVGYYLGAASGASLMRPFYLHWGWSGVVAISLVALLTAWILVLRYMSASSSLLDDAAPAMPAK